MHVTFTRHPEMRYYRRPHALAEVGTRLALANGIRKLRRQAGLAGLRLLTVLVPGRSYKRQMMYKTDVTNGVYLVVTSE